MTQTFKLALAVALLAGIASVHTAAQAESTKSKAASETTQKQAAGDDFEENRRAHMEKSKENNAKKGAN